MNNVIQNAQIQKIVMPIGLLVCISIAEPIVISGSMVKKLIGKPLADIRITDRQQKSIPFQIDEVTSNGEYVCDRGPQPNVFESNGILDSTDEIVFLWEDIPKTVYEAKYLDPDAQQLIIRKTNEEREVYVSCAPHIELSAKKYIGYDSSSNLLQTPFYYAQFEKDRFHFTRAGIINLQSGCYENIANELRINIFLHSKLDLFTIHFNENNIICTVKRYKTGPIRHIRRGDFHLGLGLWVKGSRAAVTQICYPKLVSVPVYVQLPIRLSRLFTHAYIEMSPVLTREAVGFKYKAPDAAFSIKIGDNNKIDTIVKALPVNSLMSVDNGRRGYGWLLTTSASLEYFRESGYIYCQPTERQGVAHCGYRLLLRELPRGNYLIWNWVFFASDSLSELSNIQSSIISPAYISTDNSDRKVNRLTIVEKFKKKVD